MKYAGLVCRGLVKEDKEFMLPYANRRDAGRTLAAALTRFQPEARENGVVLALPRGGVPVGFEVARRLRLPLDVCVVRKLGVPGHRELAMGALATGGVRVLDRDALAVLDVQQSEIERITETERQELIRRELIYRGQHPPLQVTGKLVIVVDDGLATGASMRAALLAVRQHEPERVVVGVPVASRLACDDLSREADEIVCVAMPEPFYAVSLWYEDFAQLTDAEVTQLLEESRQLAPAA